MVNFKFAKFHCYQQIQSFLITPYSHVQINLGQLLYVVT
jgi:hypothetical protein